MPKGISREAEAAVRATQLLMGVRHGGRVRLQDEERLYKRMRAAIEKVAKKYNADLVDVSVQVESEARHRGAITPMLGKDL